MRERVVVLGVGQMGTAIVAGLLKAGPPALHLVDPDETRLLGPRAHGFPCSAALPGLRPTDAVLLAMPPQAFRSFAAAALPLHRHPGPIISVMAGIQVATIRELLGTEHVIRSIPNTPSEVFQGTTVFFAPVSVPAEHVARARQIFEAIGTAVRVDDETLMDPSTALCGGGPAFVAFIADAMQRFGVRAGLAQEDSVKVTLQVLRGTAELMEASGKPALQICREVMTPNGTTERGIQHFEACSLTELICSALEKSSARSRELGALLA